MSATPEQIGKRLLWATASHVADREVLESAAAAFSLTVRYCSPNELASFLRPGGDHLVGIELTDIETQFPALFERFYSSTVKRTCSNCGTVLERAR